MDSLNWHYKLNKIKTMYNPSLRKYHHQFLSYLCVRRVILINRGSFSYVIIYNLLPVPVEVFVRVKVQLVLIKLSLNFFLLHVWNCIKTCIVTQPAERSEPLFAEYKALISSLDTVGRPTRLTTEQLLTLAPLFARNRFFPQDIWLLKPYNVQH